MGEEVKEKVKVARDRRPEPTSYVSLIRLELILNVQEVIEWFLSDWM